MIDSHCHLADRKFTRDLDQILLRAKEAGVEKCVTIADTLKESKQCIEIAEKYPEVFATVGVHPHGSRAWGVGDRDNLILMLKKDKVVALGEIGLDYHYDNSPRDVQRDVFKIQLELAKELDVPVVVHCRSAIADLKSIIEEVDHKKIVLHCCTEKWEDVEWLVEKGAMIGFTGIATYPKSQEIREVIGNCPLEQIMIETDAPYLAPDPHRGKRNEPAFVVEVAKLIARLKNVSLEEVDKMTTKNTVEFYGLPS
ncbi:TatD family hydrolase [Patescibacteria group bacterium]|nr:TatD family hydrolase [Patescibacteria group bacterium]